MFDLNFRFYLKFYTYIKILRSVGLRGGQNIKKLFLIDYLFAPFTGIINHFLRSGSLRPGRNMQLSNHVLNIVSSDHGADCAEFVKSCSFVTRGSVHICEGIRRGVGRTY